MNKMIYGNMNLEIDVISASDREHRDR